MRLRLSAGVERRFRTILCPVDFSEPARTALRYAATIARRSAGHVTVLYVNDPLLIGAAAAVYHRTGLAQRTRAELLRFVRTSIPTGTVKATSIRSTVSLGDPAREILSAARRLGSDLIVMGTHGLSGIDKLFFGSTAEHVLRRAAIAVLAVPSTHAARKSTRNAPLVSWPITRLIAPIDLGEQSERDARQAADLALWFDARLLLVHVVSKIQTPPWLRANLAAHDRIRIATAQSTLESVRTALGPKIKAACRVVMGDPADEIAALAAKERSGLVVMTLHGEGGLWVRGLDRLPITSRPRAGSASTGVTA